MCMQDPYLDYLALTGGSGFGSTGAAARVAGIVMLVIGGAIVAGVALLCCCCAALVRRARRHTHGLPLGYWQGLLYEASQRCAL
jgi:hypothetical protein